MSRKCNCYDNAYIESFFATLKRELVHGEKYHTREEVRLSIFEYIEVFYPSTKRTTALAVGELVLWYGMFAPAGRNDGTTGLPVGLHNRIRKHLSLGYKSPEKYGKLLCAT